MVVVFCLIWINQKPQFQSGSVCSLQLLLAFFVICTGSMIQVDEVQLKTFLLIRQIILTKCTHV